MAEILGYQVTLKVSVPSVGFREFQGVTSSDLQITNKLKERFFMEDNGSPSYKSSGADRSFKVKGLVNVNASTGTDADFHFLNGLIDNNTIFDLTFEINGPNSEYVGWSSKGILENVNLSSDSENDGTFDASVKCTEGFSQL